MKKLVFIFLALLTIWTAVTLADSTAVGNPVPDLPETNNLINPWFNRASYEGGGDSSAWLDSNLDGWQIGPGCWNDSVKTEVPYSQTAWDIGARRGTAARLNTGTGQGAGCPGQDGITSHMTQQFAATGDTAVFSTYWVTHGTAFSLTAVLEALDGSGATAESWPLWSLATNSAKEWRVQQPVTVSLGTNAYTDWRLRLVGYWSGDSAVKLTGVYLSVASSTPPEPIPTPTITPTATATPTETPIPTATPGYPFLFSCPAPLAATVTYIITDTVEVDCN